MVVGVTPITPKRILNADLSYLPKCTEYFYQFKKLTLSLKMTTTQVVETSVTVNNSPI